MQTRAGKVASKQLWQRIQAHEELFAREWDIPPSVGQEKKTILHPGYGDILPYLLPFYNAGISRFAAVSLTLIACS